ncbi:MAG: hypothetical protein DME08_14450, partial [Candidatus Rokuibacteriota bacterium]
MLLARPPEDYEDLLQESLLKAFNGFDTFVRDLPFKAWVFAIIRNTHIDRQRRRKTSSLEDPLIDTQTAGLLQSPLFAIPLAPEDILLRQETIERVREGIR